MSDSRADLTARLSDAMNEGDPEFVIQLLASWIPIKILKHCVEHLESLKQHKRMKP